MANYLFRIYPIWFNGLSLPSQKWHKLVRIHLKVLVKLVMYWFSKLQFSKNLSYTYRSSLCANVKSESVSTLISYIYYMCKVFMNHRRQTQCSIPSDYIHLSQRPGTSYRCSIQPIPFLKRDATPPAQLWSRWGYTMVKKAPLRYQEG